MRAELLRDTHTHGDRARRNLVRFLDRVVRFEEREAVVELHVERIFLVKIPRVFDRRVLRLPKWFFDSADGFHSRPSLLSSSMTLINFLLGIQPSIPRIRCDIRVE